MESGVFPFCSSNFIFFSPRARRNFCPDGISSFEKSSSTSLRLSLIHFAISTMAPIKRKGNVAEEATARQPQKRVRVGEEDRQNEKKSKSDASAEKSSAAPKASELTVLRDDEPSFPRGGGSVLTPLERKQIQIQATKDVLFEQKGPKGSSANVEADDDEDEEMDDADDTTAKKSRKRKTKGQKRAEKDHQEEQTVRIEGLNFKVCLRRGIYYPHIQVHLLMKSAACSGIHGTRSGCKHQCSRYRSFLAQ